MIKPSQLMLSPHASFAGLFNSSEVEFTAALIVRICALNGDEWGSVTGDQVVSYLTTKPDALARRWGDNPFLRVDISRAMRDGVVQATSDHHAFGLTERAIKILSESRYTAPARTTESP